MSKTKISAFKKPAAAIKSQDDWVNEPSVDISERKVASVPKQKTEPMKRFTLDVTESLHKRIKAQCAARGEKMADTLRGILEKEFPADLS